MTGDIILRILFTVTASAAPSSREDCKRGRGMVASREKLLLKEDEIQSKLQNLSSSGRLPSRVSAVDKSPYKAQQCTIFMSLVASESRRIPSDSVGTDALVIVLEIQEASGEEKRGFSHCQPKYIKLKPTPR